MKKLTNSKSLIIVLSLILSFSLSGCSLIPSLNLTDEEQKVISEYAAGLLLKYDRNYAGSILNQKQVDQNEKIKSKNAPMPEEEPVLEVPIAEEEILPEGEGGEFPDPEFSEDLTAAESEGVEDILYSDVSIADSIGTPGFEITYNSYECAQVYPPEGSQELMFSLQAAPGMELIVLNFSVANTAADRMKFDVLNTDALFRLIVNGSERIQVQKTMLLNDLGTYSDDIEGYGAVNTVLVFEAAEGTSASISSLDLVVKTDAGSTTHRLQ